jgi:hypothetical protein
MNDETFILDQSDQELPQTDQESLEYVASDEMLEAAASSFRAMQSTAPHPYPGPCRG